MTHTVTLLAAMLLAAAAAPWDALAHAGPPFPIVSRQIAGPYRVSVWTDPDATDDGSPGGQFWVVLEQVDRGGPPPPDAAVFVSIRPLSRPGEPQTGRAQPVDGNPSRQFVALVMDHEGPFAVNVTIPSADGEVRVDAEVEATYDLRPPPTTAVLYLMPFLLVGGLWLKLLLRRRRERLRAEGAPSSQPAAEGRPRRAAR